MQNGGRTTQQTLQLNQEEEKSISRHLSKEISKVESSFRVLYYGKSSGAVPFMWESQPGTPKHKFSDTSLPPLTPPPSYQFSPKSNSIRKPNSKPRFLHTILKMGSRKSHVSPSFSSSSSSGSSVYSGTSVIDRRNSNVRSRSELQYGADEDEEQGRGASPNSTLCFGTARNGGSSREQGVKNVKKALWAILGHGRD